MEKARETSIGKCEAVLAGSLILERVCPVSRNKSRGSSSEEDTWKRGDCARKRPFDFSEYSVSVTRHECAPLPRADCPLPFL